MTKSKNYSAEELQAIYYLKIYYEKMLDILNAYCTNSLLTHNPELNFYYVKLSKAVEEALLHIPDSHDLHTQKPELPDNLLGDIRNIDVYWQNQYAPKGYEFYGKIETLFADAGSKQFKLDDVHSEFLKNTDEAIKRHIKVVTEEMDRITYKGGISCGDLVLNLKKTTLQYKDRPLIEISPDTSEIKFLLLLMKNKRVVEYKEFAEKLDLNSYQPDFNNKDYSREVQLIKKKVNAILEDAGMTREQINNMIIAKKNLGYKMVSIK